MAQQALRIEQRERTTCGVDNRAAFFWKCCDVIDLIDAQAAQDAVCFDHERAVTLSCGRSRGLIQQSADIQNRKDGAVQIADTTEGRRRGRNRRHEAKGHDLADPAKLDCVSCRPNCEHDDIAELWHAASIPCPLSPGAITK